MRDPIKADSQSEATIGLKLYLPREDALGLVRGSAYGQDLLDKDKGPTAIRELLVGSQFLGAREKHRLSGTEGEKSSHPRGGEWVREKVESSGPWDNMHNLDSTAWALRDYLLQSAFVGWLKIENKYPNQRERWSPNLSLTMYNSQLASPGKPKGTGPGLSLGQLDTYRSNLTAILMTPEVSSAGSSASSGVLARNSARRESSSRVVSS